MSLLRDYKKVMWGDFYLGEDVIELDWIEALSALKSNISFFLSINIFIYPTHHKQGIMIPLIILHLYQCNVKSLKYILNLLQLCSICAWQVYYAKLILKVKQKFGCCATNTGIAFHQIVEESFGVFGYFESGVPHVIIASLIYIA